MDDKLPKCGCGGGAECEAAYGDDSSWHCWCPDCLTSTGWFVTEAEARAAWTRAMSAPAPGMEAMRELLARCADELDENSCQFALLAKEPKTNPWVKQSRALALECRTALQAAERVKA